MTRPVDKGTHHRWCRTCGWEGTYDTARRADYAKRRHSCEKWLAKAEAAARHAARIAAVDRTPKPCLHKQAGHQHGTQAAYTLDRCRCLPCVQARTAADTWRSRQKAYGRYDKYVPADEARTHLRSLMAQGMGLGRIQETSGISMGVLWKLLYGKRQPDGSQTPSRRILRTTHERVMATSLDLADGAKVDNTGATRRVQALVALGWSQSKLAARLGILPSNLTALAHGTRRVTVATDKAVRALYDELSLTLPPEATRRDRIAASRARNYAKRHRWAPPLAWDDEQIDDPAATPHRTDYVPFHQSAVDEVAVLRRMAGDKTVRVNHAEQAEVVRRLTAAGVSLAEIERRTGINPWRTAVAS